MFAITSFRHTEVLFHVFYYTLVKKIFRTVVPRISLYRDSLLAGHANNNHGMIFMTVISKYPQV